VPFISYRLNDKHLFEYLNDTPPPPHAGNSICQFYVDNPDYRIGTNINNIYQRVHNWAIPEAREYKFQFIQEICENYDIPGLELDFMRHCSFFRLDETTSSERRQIMTNFVTRVRDLLDRTTPEGEYRWLCVRVPCYIEAYDALGIDLNEMVNAGVDMVNLSPYYFTDQQGDIAEIVSIIPDTPVYLEMTHTPLKVDASLKTTLEQYYTTANLAYSQGAGGISTFNFQYYRESPGDVAPYHEPPFNMFEHIGDPNWVANQDHHYFLGAVWNHPPLATRPLPKTFSEGQTDSFTIKMSPEQYRDGKLRIRAEESLGSSTWSAKFNGNNLSETTDVSEIYYNPYPDAQGGPEDYRAWLVPKEYYQSGDNTIELTLNSGTSAKIIWIDLITPSELVTDPVLYMNASKPGSVPDLYWKPEIGHGDGLLIGDSEHIQDVNKTWFYRFSDPDTDNDQVVDIDNSGVLEIGSDAYTFEAWVRLPSEIPNIKKQGIVIGNTDFSDTGWRFGVRCDSTSGKYSLEFLQRDNEDTVTVLKDGFHFRSDNILEYSTSQWTHLVFAKHPASYNSNTGEIEIDYDMWADGSLLDSGTKTVAADSMSDFLFTTGNEVQISTSRNDMYYVGDIAVVRVYNRVLNQSDVTQLYNSGFDAYCSELLKYDINGDCIINGIDFAPLAENWLDDGRIEASMME
jgi:hypothetical protein